MDNNHGGIEHSNHSKSLSLVTFLSENSKKLDPDPDVIDGTINHAYSVRQLEAVNDDDDESEHFEIQPRQMSCLIVRHGDDESYVEESAEILRIKSEEKNQIMREENVTNEKTMIISNFVHGLNEKSSIRKLISSSDSMEEFFQVDTNKVALLPPDPHTHKSKKHDEDINDRASTSNVSKLSDVSKGQSLSPVQSPPIQVMSRVGEYDPNRIMSLLPPRKSTTSVDWSFASNDSLFSLHMGNNSFSREYINTPGGHHGRSRELNRSQEMIVLSKCPPIPQIKADEREIDPQKKKLTSTSQAPFYPKKSVLQSWSTQSPPIQVMDRVGGYDPNRIPSFVFERKYTTTAEWSVASTESLFSIHVGNNSFSRDTYITICEEPLTSRELDKSKEMIVYNPTPPIPLMEADKEILEPEMAVDQIQNNSVTEATTDDQSFRKKTTLRVTQSSSSPFLISNRYHHSDLSVKSNNSYAFPIRTKSKKKRKKCAWPQFYCSKCDCTKCIGPSCCCCSLGCMNCIQPSCQCSNCGFSRYTWSSCYYGDLGCQYCALPSCHCYDCCCSKCAWPYSCCKYCALPLCQWNHCCCSKCAWPSSCPYNSKCKTCSWSSCCCSNCDCTTCAWTCQYCNCSWKKCSWPSCHCIGCSWEFCRTWWLKLF